MTECRYCHSTSVSWSKTKAGKPMLVEVRPPIPHFRFCPKQKKPLKQKSLGKAPGRSQRAKDAIAGLRNLGLKARESTAAVDAVREDCTGGGAELVKAALIHRDEERLAHVAKSETHGTEESQ